MPLTGCSACIRKLQITTELKSRRWINFSYIFKN